MAYRRPTRTRRPAYSAGRKRTSARTGGKGARKAKNYKRSAAPKRRAASKGLSKTARQQVLRIVLTHEPVSPVERPAGAGATVAAPRKARF